MADRDEKETIRPTALERQREVERIRRRARGVGAIADQIEGHLEESERVAHAFLTKVLGSLRSEERALDVVAAEQEARS